jgi:hypothetical protein
MLGGWRSELNMGMQAYLVIEVLQDGGVSACPHFMCQRKQPLPEVDMTAAATLARVLRHKDLVRKL